jgi:outer membrane scaffolding protein for murein synthesis (MipA/OmpV family)
MPLTVLVRSRQATATSRGLQADLRVSAGVFQSGPFGAGLFAQGIWANARSAQTYYGVSAPGSVATGLPAFDAGSGWTSGSVGLLWSVALHPRWVLVGSLEARRLQGDAARSPFTQRSSGHYLSAGLAYRP